MVLKRINTMKIFGFNIERRNTEQQIIKEERGLFADGLTFNTISSYNSSNSLRLSSVFACVNAISNSVAVLPLKLYSVDNEGYKKDEVTHQLNKIINKQPSKNLSKFNFFKLIVTSVLLEGNGYAHILRDKKGKVLEIRYIAPERVTIAYNEKTDTILYYVVGIDKPVESINMLHFWMYSNNNINGISTISYAVNTLKLTSDSEKHASNFYKSGAALSGILKQKDGKPLDEKQSEQIKSKWNNTFSGTDNGGVTIISANLDYQPISVNARDSQLLESRNFSVLEVCRFFGVSPLKVFDLTHSSFSSLEQTSLDFLESTIKPWLNMIENEVNRKIFLPSEQLFLSTEFDVTSMLSTDKAGLATYYKTLFDTGVLSINEIRKALNYNNIEFGDNNFLQLNISTLKNIVEGNFTKEQEVIKQKVKGDKDIIE